MQYVKKSIALIGLGYWGKNILRNLYELRALHTACDCNAKILGERKKEFPGAKYTRSLDKVLNNNEIRAVIIATPASTHYDLASKSLIAGKDVLVEKPLSLFAKEGERLVRLAEGSGRILMVGHLLQYHPAIVKLKELITKGTLGKIQYIYSNRLNIGKLRTEENILWSFAPHDISAILMLLGEYPKRISAFGGAYVDKKVKDVTLTTLEFKNGAKGHIFVSWLHPYKEQKLIIVGSNGMAVFDDISKEKLFIYPHRIGWRNGRVPIAWKAKHCTIHVENKEPLKEELKHFIDCIRERRQPRTDGMEALKVLMILEAAEKSLLGGGVKQVL